MIEYLIKLLRKIKEFFMGKRPIPRRAERPTPIQTVETPEKEVNMPKPETITLSRERFDEIIKNAVAGAVQELIAATEEEVKPDPAEERIFHLREQISSINQEVLQHQDSKTKLDALISACLSKRTAAEHEIEKLTLRGSI
jgi:hypothetical protein